MTSTPEQFAHKLLKASKAAGEQQHRGIEARAKVTQKYILAAAKVRMPRKANPGWVRYTLAGDVATVLLRGGFAYLNQLGSYKKPEGWDETPKTVSNRRVKNAAKKGVVLHEAGALRTPYGPRASVHHPPLRARPFFREGLDASRVEGHEAYKKVVLNSISDALR